MRNPLAEKNPASKIVSDCLALADHRRIKTSFIVSIPLYIRRMTPTPGCHEIEICPAAYADGLFARSSVFTPERRLTLFTRRGLAPALQRYVNRQRGMMPPLKNCEGDSGDRRAVLRSRREGQLGASH